MELGTGHQTCTDISTYRFWYGWFSDGVTSTSFFVNGPIGPANHQFLVFKTGSYTWNWQIDATLMASLTVPNSNFGAGRWYGRALP